ncbi:MAG: hypothetical protein PF542_06095 [Nanoarchaeota archaeon]|jgi:ribosome-binding protein aMBF1 (putative translation factor)|nr:hypothetical protein [Nanoarchaeota archaeon]
MTSCFHCGNSEKSELLETIYKTGVVSVCKNCYPKFRLPIIEKKIVDWAEVERKGSVRERLTDMAHVNVNKKVSVEKKKNPEDMTLRDIVEQNFEKNKVVASEVPTDLVDNYNWVIMRKRRALQISSKELAEKLREPELIVSALEKGVLPRDYTTLVRKVEAVLSVRLFKEVKNSMSSNDIIAESKSPTGILVSEVRAKTSFFDWFKKKKDVSVEKVNAVLEADGNDNFQASNKQKVWERAVANVRSEKEAGYESSVASSQLPTRVDEAKVVMPEPIVRERPVVAPIQKVPNMMDEMRASRERLRGDTSFADEIAEAQRLKVKEPAVQNVSSEEEVYKDLMKAKEDDLFVDNFSLDSVNDLIGEPVVESVVSRKSSDQVKDNLEDSLFATREPKVVSDEDYESYESRMDGGFSAVDDSLGFSVETEIDELVEEPSINEFNSPHSYMTEEIKEERQASVYGEPEKKESKKDDLDDEDISDLIWGRK